MAEPSSSAAERCSHLLLSAFMDYLGLPDILRSMRVSRFWREQAINHPIYYGDLNLSREDPPGYVEFILLRLSRSAGRPVSIWLSLGAPHPPSLIEEVASHLAHITHLSVELARDHSYAPVLEALCRPAPVLRELALLSFPPVFNPGRPPSLEALRRLSLPPSALPADIFAGHAPLLDQVQMLAVAFGPEIPRCFSGVRLLNLGSDVFSPHPLVLPNPFERCPKLDMLQLGDMVTLHPSLRLERDGWARLSQLWICSRALADDWHLLPVANLPRIVLSVGDLAGACALAETIVGPVDLEFRMPRRLGTAGHGQAVVSVDSILRSVSKPGIRRDLWGDLSANGAGGVFGLPSLAGRVMRLALPLAGWDDLVGFSAFGPFDALEELTLILTAAAAAAADDGQWTTGSANLPCPRLKCMVLRVREGTAWEPVEQVAVDIARVAAFMHARLSRVVFPLKLELDGITLAGPSCDTFPVTFSGCASRAK